MDFRQIKTSKPFKPWDLLLYCLILLLVFALFFAFVIFPADSASDSTGFKIILNDKEVFVFDYTAGTFSVEPEFSDVIAVEIISDGVYSVKIYSDKSTGAFNTVLADTTARTVSVSESNCSESKECVHTPSIVNSRGVIICAPHKLKIVPVTNYRPVVTG